MKTCKSLVYLCSICLIVFFEIDQAFASGTIVTNNLEGYWHYQQGISGTAWENIAPSTIGQNNGTIVGTTLQSDGVEFDGNDYVVTTYKTGLNDYTLEMGFKTEDISTGFFLLGKGDTLYTIQYSPVYGLVLTNNGDAVRTYYMLNPYTEYQISIVWDRTTTGASAGGNYYLYMNGVQVFTAYASSVGWNNNTKSLHIGHYTNSTSGGLRGKVKYVRLYNRNLSPAEVSQNQSGGDDIGLAVPRSWNLTSPNAIVDFGTITVNHQVQIVKANIGTMPVEHTGDNSDGWKVTVSATPFSQTGGGSLSLPTNSLSIRGIQSVNQTSGASVLPVSSGASWIIDAGAVEVLRAPAGTGEGSFNVIFPPNALELMVDTSTIVVDPLNNPTRYESIITWNMSVGP